MSSESTFLLVRNLPTFLALVIIILCTLRGFIRGFRKSFILLIHYLISIVVGLINYASSISVIMSDELNGYFAAYGPEFADANSVFDVIRIILSIYLPDYAAVAANPYIEQAIMAFGGLVLSFFLGIICLVIIPWIVRFFLYLLYLLFYREGKVKRHKLAEGDDYRPHRILGMFVGAARGVVCTLLTVTLLSSAYFVLSGGVVQTENTPTENILILESISDQIGFDLNAVYKGLKESRTTGVGNVFNSILVDGKPIDLYYSDLFFTSTFKTNSKKQEGTFYTGSTSYDGEMATFYLREELALIVNLLENVLETNAITIVDGNVNVDYELLEESLGSHVTDFVENSVIVGEITPLAIIGLAEAINDGSLVVDSNIKSIFTTEVIEEIKKINFSNDLSALISVAFNAVDLIPINEETNSFDFAAFSNIDTYFNFNTETVKKLFSDLSNIKLLTKVVFPAGIGLALESMGETIAAAGIDATQLDFDVDWQSELANLGSIYEKIIDLNLDINKLMDTELNESGLTNNIQYIIDLCTDETLVEDQAKSEIFKADLLELIDAVFNSKLLGQVGLVFIKSQIAGIEILYEDGSSTPLNDAFGLIKENLNYYTTADLKSDLHQIFSSCLNVVDLIPLFMGGEEVNIFELINSIETADLKKLLLGDYTTNVNPESDKTPLDTLYTSGLYSIKLLNGSLSGDANYAIDALISGALKTYAANIMSIDNIDSITGGLTANDENYNYLAWPTELTALIDAVAELQTVDNLDKINFKAEDISEILPPEITTNDIDAITYAASKSLLLSNLVEEMLVSMLGNEPTIGSAVNDPNIVWMDTITVDGAGKEVVLKGEINSLLKAFIIYSDDSKGIDLSNVDSLINGLAMLLHEAEADDLYVKNGLDYQEVVTFTNSQILMKLLAKEISAMGAGSSEGIGLIVPYSLNSSIEGNEDKWQSWAYDEMYNHMNGEFANLVLVLYHARLHLLDTNVSLQNSSTPVLTLSNLINAVIYMDNDDYIVQSKVLHASISDALLKQVNDESIVKVREAATGNYPNLNPESLSNYKAIKPVEIARALSIVRCMEIDFTSGDFSKINLKTVLDIITTEEGEDPASAELARKNLCMSNIFNITAISKIAENSLICVPEGYYDSTNSKNKFDYNALYPTSEANWKDSEINKILESVIALGLEVNDDGSLNFPSDPIEFLNTLNESKISALYASKIFKYTISVNALNNVPDYRDEAIEVDEKENEFVKEHEINLILNFLKEAGINSQQDMEEAITNTSKILNIIKNSSTLNTIIAESNILNICVVGVLKDSPLSFPEKFTMKNDNNETVVNIDASAWYPVGTGENGKVTLNDIKNSELYKLLNSVVILNLGVNTEGGLKLSPTEILNTFKDKDKLYAVYEGEILSLTITNEVMKIGINAREKAFNPANNKAFYVSEIEMLVDFINLTNIDIENNDLDAEHIFGSSIESNKGLKGILYDDTKYSTNSGSIAYNGNTVGEVATEILIRSNILNATMINNIVGKNEIDRENSLLVFPNAYFINGSNYINPEFGYWYHDSTCASDDWANGELYNLLLSMKTLNIKAHGNEIDLDIDQVLADLVTPEESKIAIIYNSDIFATTVSKRLLTTTSSDGGESAIELPTIRSNGQSIFYTVEGRLTLEDSVILEEEIEALLLGFEALNSNASSQGFDYGNILDTVTIDTLLQPSGNSEGETKLDVVLKSSILQYVISDNLINQKQSINSSTSYSIVTWDYYLNESTMVPNYIEQYDDYIYISTVEIVNMVTALSKFGVTSIDEASSFNSNTILQYFTADYDREELVTAVINSSIVSMMFSQIISNNQMILLLIQQSTGQRFLTYEVLGILETETAKAYTQADLAVMLSSL